jgi:hypothetical protein
MGSDVIGHQALVNNIRTLGANNVILADGAAYSGQLQGIPMLSDTSGGRGIVYAPHTYYYTMANPASTWASRYGYLTATVPLISTEWNYMPAACGTIRETLAPTFLSYLETNHIGLLAHALDVPGTIIKDWSWTPTTCSTATSGPGITTQNYFLNLFQKGY